jgi:6-phosphogluconate dehydrogenase
MQIAMVGLGKMGANMAVRLLEGGHHVIVYDLNEGAIKATEEKGAIGARTLDELVEILDTPRVAWIMVPSGKPTKTTIKALAERFHPGDVIIDGGNSYYKDSMDRGKNLDREGIHFVDVGTSGGIWGLTEGYSMMVGGAEEVVERLHPVFETLAPGTEQGWGHVGPHGAGHFVKMVHNGIEYGLMQAYAEGFELMRAKTEFNLDLHQVAEIWRYGSVVRSWLLDLTAAALADDQELGSLDSF